MNSGYHLGMRIRTPTQQQAHAEFTILGSFGTNLASVNFHLQPTQSHFHICAGFSQIAGKYAYAPIFRIRESIYQIH